MKQVKALELVEEGCRAAAENDIEHAIHCFQESLSYYPTAEAYTYLGWMISFKGDYQKAIELCKKAIEVDPDFGNPYNDIGSYLMKQNKFDDAIAWLEKAKKSARYGPRHYPYINLGRIYIERGWLSRAIEEFKAVLQIDPDNTEIQQILHDLEVSVH